MKKQKMRVTKGNEESVGELKNYRPLLIDGLLLTESEILAVTFCRFAAVIGSV
jgi:hypothetical protein